MASARTLKGLARSDIVFQMRLPPNRMDIVTGIDGVGFGEAWAERVATLTSFTYLLDTLLRGT